MKYVAMSRWLAGGVAGVVLAAASAIPASAEVDTVRMSQQFGLIYLAQHVIFDHKLIQKHAKRLGIKEPKVQLFKISGGANINKALLADTIDFGMHGVGPALKLWGKTKGRFKIALSLVDMPLVLNTNDPSVKTLQDYLKAKDHKIATPAAKVSIQAVLLQMAVAKIWGNDNAEKLDHLVVSMKHPTAYAALVSGGQTVKSHFANLPFWWQEVQNPKIHTVISSYDIMDGPHTVLVMSASKKFKEANPKTYDAVVAAHLEAFKWIDANPEKASEVFIRYTKSKLDPADVLAMVKDKNTAHFTPLPKKTMRFGNFLAGIGDIPQPKSWKEYFWENNHHLNGS